MGLNDFLKDVGDSIASGVNWAGESVFGADDMPEEYRKGGAKEGQLAPFGKGTRDNVVSRGAKTVYKNSLEDILHGMVWAYDNGFSQPFSTVDLMLQVYPQQGDWGSLFSASKWGQAYDAAEHISPGQALWMSNQEAEESLTADPLYFEPDKAYLPDDWDKLSLDEQQKILKEVGMPIAGNRTVARIQRDVSYFNFASGATDFAFRWYADPTVVGLKIAARANRMRHERPPEGFSRSEIDKLMNKSAYQKMVQGVWENAGNTPLIRNLRMFRESGMGGDRAASIVSTLKSEDEVRSFFAVGHGDTLARARLQEQNLLAANRLEKDTARLSELDLHALPRTIAQGNTAAQALVERRIAELQKQVNADEALVARYGEIAGKFENGKLVSPGVFGELDKVYVSRWSMKTAQRRAAAQAAYVAGPARGEKLLSTPLDNGTTFHRVYGAKDFFSTPITVMRSFKEYRPNGWMKVDDLDRDSIVELRSFLARIPGLGADGRTYFLDRYLKTRTEGERVALLREIQDEGIVRVAMKHGLSKDKADELVKAHYAEKSGVLGTLGKDAMYSATRYGPLKLRVDHFLTEGGKLHIHPNTVSRLRNEQTLVDLATYDKVLARHGSALRAYAGPASEFVTNNLDLLNSVWKFGTLLRLGYIPRVLGDDLAGQMARLGAATMALRAGFGMKNLATNAAAYRPRAFYEARGAVAKEGARFADEALKGLQPQARALQRKVDFRAASDKADLRRAQRLYVAARKRLEAAPVPVSREKPLAFTFRPGGVGAGDSPITPGVSVMEGTGAARRYAAMEKFVAKREQQIRAAERRLASGSPGKNARLAQYKEQIAHLEGERARALLLADEATTAAARGFRQSSQLYNRPVIAGVQLPASMEGREGQYFQKMISADDSMRNVMESNKSLAHGALLRSWNHGAKPIDPVVGKEAEHANAWAHAVNAQLVQDGLAVQAVRGASVEQMTHWLRYESAGREYYRRLGIQFTTKEDIAARVKADVDEYLPTPEIRAQALTPEGVSPKFLQEAMPHVAERPTVHTGQLGENLAGSNGFSRQIDQIMSQWFRFAAAIPADRMSRHPLFNQLYEGHARSLISQEFKQGQKVAQKDVDALVTTARRLALRDTRRLVFDIAHRTDAGAALRFISPFFVAAAEGWQRWARIIGDRPQVVGYAGQFYNAPLALGWTQDSDGNKVDRHGYAVSVNDETGKTERRLVPKSERRITVRVPQSVVDSDIGKKFGMDSLDNKLRRFNFSYNSLFLVTQGDPWFHPGTGPIVQIPVNEWVKDKPSDAEVMRKIGVLPFGPSRRPTALGATADFLLPRTLKDLRSALDTSDSRYQDVKLHIMQRAVWEHENLDKPMPTATEIAGRARNYWFFSAVSAFASPVANRQQDPYQFYRDQYNILRRRFAEDPGKVDQEFIDRFGESYFIFAQATSENKSGLPPTKRAVELSQKHADLIAQFPELGPLIVGPEGNGPFSPEAYVYQLTTPVTPGGPEAQRTKMSADEAMKENHRRAGWARFSQVMNDLRAQLHARGLVSFEDEGAEDLRETKTGLSKLMSLPTLPDGNANPYYNAEWAEEFGTFSPGKYDRLMPALEAVANSDLADGANRSDLRVLREYLQMRRGVQRLLFERNLAGGSAALTAASNADLRTGWARWVDARIERDTRFGDLHSRYLSRDLGVDVEEETELVEAE